MILLTVMQEIAARLDTIDGLRVYDHPADKITPPAAVVAYPDGVDFDATYRRGVDRMTLPVFLLAGRMPGKTARDNLVAYADGAGEKSIKTVLESGTYTGVHTVRVASAVFAVYRVGDVDYAGAQFTLDITGRGGV